MTDYFALLGQPRRPWLDADQLKHQFHQLSAAVHPDRNHGLDEAARKSANDCYAELNAAYQCLRQPKSRLAHLLLLEHGTKPGDLRDIPGGVAELFGEVGALLRASAGIITERERAVSAIQKAGVLTRALPMLERIAELQARIQQQRGEVDEQIRALDASWVAPGTQNTAKSGQLFAELEGLYHHVGFLDRWGEQLQERVVQLTL